MGILGYRLFSTIVFFLILFRINCLLQFNQAAQTSHLFYSVVCVFFFFECNVAFVPKVLVSSVKKCHSFSFNQFAQPGKSNPSYTIAFVAGGIIDSCSHCQSSSLAHDGNALRDYHDHQGYVVAGRWVPMGIYSLPDLPDLPDLCGPALWVSPSGSD